MPKRIQLVLSEQQQQELRQIRDQHPKAYLRERAAALLKVASGSTLTEVAEHGLYKRHEPETVHGWIKRYHQRGVAGLQVNPGSGRKPKFFPRNGGDSQNNRD